MKLKIITYFIVLSTFIASIFFMSAKNKEVEEVKRSLKRIQESRSFNDDLLYEIKDYQLKVFKHNNKVVKDIVLTDSVGNKESLSKLIDGKNKLVFNFASTNCSECYGLILELIKDYKGKDLLVIFNTDNFRAYKFFMSNNHLVTKTYAADLGGTNLPSEVDNLPCFFTINKNLTISNVFFPSKGDPEFTKAYLKLFFQSKYSQ